VFDLTGNYARTLGLLVSTASLALLLSPLAIPAQQTAAPKRGSEP
jgi:hypothetical protein